MVRTASLRSTVMSRLEEFRIRANQKLGQHFLMDEEVLSKIASEVKKQAVVIEIGPGIGQLTEALLDSAKEVIAIEIDYRFISLLEVIHRQAPNLRIINADALQINLARIMEKQHKQRRKVQIIANLPYQITEPFLHRVAGLPVERVSLLVGKRFAQAATTINPNSTHFTNLSLLVNAFFEAEYLLDVPKNAFFPPPKTESAVIRLIPLSHQAKALGPNKFVIQYLFKTRETSPLIKNALKEGIITFSKEIIEKNIKVQNLTQKQSKKIIAKLDLPDTILHKTFSQLNNREVQILAQKMDQLEFLDFSI